MFNFKSIKKLHLSSEFVMHAIQNPLHSTKKNADTKDDIFERKVVKYSQKN